MYDIHEEERCRWRQSGMSLIRLVHPRENEKSHCGDVVMVALKVPGSWIRARLRLICFIIERGLKSDI